MTRTLHRPAWRIAALCVLLAWFGAVLVLNGPGHLSADSLIQLAEGGSGVMTSFNPVFITVIFGKLANLGGPRLLVVCSSLMLLFALLALLPGVDRPRFAGVVVLACALAGPIMLIYPAIVWKDVWFAHFALSGFAVIALRHRLPWILVEVGSLLLFAAAMLSRQNGAIVAACGMVTLAWARGSDDAVRAGNTLRLRSLFANVGARLAVLALSVLALSWMARQGVDLGREGEYSTGIRLLFNYDIAGMTAREPDVDLSLLAASGVDVAAFARLSRANYSPERIDSLALDEITTIGEVPLKALAGQWLTLAAANPQSYFAHRADGFAWLLGLHDQSHCLPVHVGFADPALVAKAGVAVAPSPFAQGLYEYSRRFVNTPYFSPAAWVFGSVTTLVFAIARRRFDPVVIGLQVATLAYLAAYFLISIACDFRYAYFSVLGATVGIVWLVTGGSRRRQSATSSAGSLS